MSEPLISRNPDLARLRDEGYDIQIAAGYVVLHRIPYVNAQKQVRFGSLISVLYVNGDATTPPQSHVALWAGEYPCTKEGNPIEAIRHQAINTAIDAGLVAQFQFSSNPKVRSYADHHEKLTSYAKIIAHQAIALDPTVTMTPHPPPRPAPADSVFHYLDSASPRAGINAVVAKLRNERIGIIGVGGTGSFVLDLVAKTPVAEIHLFDADRFLQHNAFRCPGAKATDEFSGAPFKVDLHAAQYGKLHRHVIPHRCFVDGTNLNHLDGLTFVFLCLDNGEAKLPLTRYLQGKGVSFIDVGMNLQHSTEQPDTLFGLVRTTASTDRKRDHIDKRISYANTTSDAYAQNIQIADLNMLNAAMAVIRWKQIRGCYAWGDQAHNAVYMISENVIINEDCA